MLQKGNMLCCCGPVGNFLFKENGSKVKTPTEKAYMNPGPDPVPQ